MTDPQPTEITLEELRTLFARLGLSPTDADLEAALPAVRLAHQSARRLEALLAAAQEPATAYHIRQSEG